jgi:hypothetical protein
LELDVGLAVGAPFWPCPLSPVKLVVPEAFSWMCCSFRRLVSGGAIVGIVWYSFSVHVKNSIFKKKFEVFSVAHAWSVHVAEAATAC